MNYSFKKILKVSLLFCAKLSAAATPFTVSGEKLKTIFESPKIWSTVTGQLQSIEYLGLKDGVSSYEIVTLEHAAKTEKDGFKILEKPVKCVFKVFLKDIGAPLAPNWIIESVDFSKCKVGTTLL
jgi:hypothetical protein